MDRSNQQERSTSTSSEEWLRANSGLTLLAIGLLLVVLAVFLIESASLAAIVGGIGAGAMILGVLLPRAEGSLKLGPGGLEIFLQQVAQRSKEADLDEEEQKDAFEAALLQWAMIVSSRGAKPDSRKSFLTFNWDRYMEEQLGGLAESVVKDVSEMHPIASDQVPEPALEAIREAAGLEERPKVKGAERRGGRGAPRWRVITDGAGIWRVSNTVHGWNARRDED